jgi:N-sulfoglucosamine sulfohydrolase
MAAILAKTLAAAAAFGAVSCVLPDREADAPLVRPNIVLMVVEDLSLRIGAFGDPVARTPNIDRLAREGVRYTEIFTASGVCAPSRAALITGMHPSSITAQHMRSTSYSWDDASGRTGYFATPPAHVKAFPELLRAAGYYTTNNAKTDYQIGSPFTIWDENGPEAHWKNASAGQPFFAMYSQTATHESGLFDPNSISEAYRSSAGALQALAQQRAALSQRTRPEDVVVPPYYPDTPTVRADIARQYDNVQVMDAWVGERMEELRRAGVLAIRQRPACSHDHPVSGWARSGNQRHAPDLVRRSCADHPGHGWRSRAASPAWDRRASTFVTRAGAGIRCARQAG